MTPRLFPHTPRPPQQIGSTPFGLDADYHDHRQDNTPNVEVDVTTPKVVGVLWAPSGQTYREVLDRTSIRFGFHTTPR